MGDFRVIVDATGGHGCQRERKDGEVLFGCRSQTCPDCVTQEFVEKMNKIAPVKKAELIHWPGQTGSVTDEFVLMPPKAESYTDQSGAVLHYAIDSSIHRIRHGNF